MQVLLIILTAASVILATYLKGTETTMTTTDNSNQPRGVRNNNPLNIEQGQNWQGEIATNDNRYEAFESPEYGFRAAARLIRNYKKFYGITTVREIVSRWAPKTENDTDSYVAFVCSEIGVPENQTLDVSNDTTLANLLLAMSVMECGRGWFTLSQAKKGVTLE